MREKGGPDQSGRGGGVKRSNLGLIESKNRAFADDWMKDMKYITIRNVVIPSFLNIKNICKGRT